MEHLRNDLILKTGEEQNRQASYLGKGIFVWPYLMAERSQVPSGRKCASDLSDAY
jgi:hypothetical protein